MTETTPTHSFTKVPGHLAIIMDGNGRWAHRQGKSASYGHRAGVEAVRSVLELANGYGIKIVTLFAFSSENWQRPGTEVKALMTLFGSYLKREVKQLHADRIRIRFIGDRHRFSAGLLKQMEQAEQLTVNNRERTLVIAVDYGGQQDIARSVSKSSLERCSHPKLMRLCSTAIFHWPIYRSPICAYALPGSSESVISCCGS
jgi:undecaprenyl diphosphate synthase